MVRPVIYSSRQGIFGRCPVSLTAATSGAANSGSTRRVVVLTSMVFLALLGVLYPSLDIWEATTTTTSTSSHNVATSTSPQPTLIPVETRDASPTNQKPQAQQLQDVKSRSSSISKTDVQEIPLDAKSTLADDLVSIVHDPTKAQITVTLKANAKCNRPYLIGRLSGPALVRLPQWTWLGQPSQTTTMTSHYQVPIVNAHYFLEIIVVFCNDFFYNFNLQDNPIHKDPPSKDWLETRPDLSHYMMKNFTGMCVENVSRHRLTLRGASIWVSSSGAAPPTGGEKQQQQLWSGFWYNKDYQGSSPEGSAGLQPVHTRFQQKVGDDEDCPEDCSQERFHPYEFRWNQEASLTVQSLKQTKQHIICLMGDSHSRFMEARAQKMGIFLEDMKLFIRNAWSAYPEDVTQQRVSDVVDNFHCNSIVLSMGHWPASQKTNGKPYTLKDYYRKMKTMFQTVIHHSRIKEKGIPVFARSLNAQPLRAWINSCPPTDWRNPVVLDSYNTIIRRICVELKVPYIDTESFLLGPVWDAARDWQHLNEATETAQTMFVAASVLQPLGLLLGESG